MSDYPADILVEVEWLSHHLMIPRCASWMSERVTRDCPWLSNGSHSSGRRAGRGARFFRFCPWSRQLGEPAQIALALAQRGIANDTRVVIYDEWTGQLAAFTYWVLRYVGHRDIKILHGGWPRGRAAKGRRRGRRLSSHQGLYHARQDDNARATAEWIQANAERPDVLLLDARTEGEYAMATLPARSTCRSILASKCGRRRSGMLQRSRRNWRRSGRHPTRKSSCIAPAARDRHTCSRRCNCSLSAHPQLRRLDDRLV